MPRKKKVNPVDYVIGLLRIGLGSIFVWAFVDKLWGLGFATCRNPETEGVETLCDSAWAMGGSPTTGFLKFATKGPFAETFQGLAGNGLVDWLFMLGLLLIGLSLILGIGVKVAATTGAVLMFLMWLAALPPEHHPVLDDHIIYIGVLTVICMSNSSQRLGFGNWWRQQDIVKQYPVLE